MPDIHPVKGGRITAAAARAARSMTRECRDLHGVLAAAKKDVHAGLTALQIVRQDCDSTSRLLNHAGAGLVQLHSVRGPCSRRTGDRHFMRRLETLAAILAAVPAWTTRSSSAGTSHPDVVRAWRCLGSDRVADRVRIRAPGMALARRASRRARRRRTRRRCGRRPLRRASARATCRRACRAPIPSSVSCAESASVARPKSRILTPSSRHHQVARA